MNSKLHFRALVAAGFLFFVAAARAQTPVDWLTGERFERQLDALVGTTWSEVPMRRAVENLSRNQQVAAFLSRRVDPDKPLELTVESTPLKSVFRRLARRQNMTVCELGPLLYIGPPRETAHLPLLTKRRQEEVKQMAPAVRGRLGQPSRWGWEDLAEPRALIEQLGREHGVRVVGMERIPHDLWPAADLPPLDFCQRLSLLLAGFELTFKFSSSGQAVQIIDVPQLPTVLRRYEVEGDTEPLLADLRKTFPEVQFRLAGKTLEVEATEEEHDLVQRHFRKSDSGTSRPAGAVDVYTLKVEETALGPVLRALTDKLKLKLDIHPALAAAMKQRVSFSVERASRDELFGAALKSSGAEFRIEGDTVKVTPPGK